MLSQVLRAAALVVAAIALIGQSALGLSPLAQSPMSLPFTGSVTDATGKPLAGVRVFGGPSDDTTTDTGGRYTLARPLDLVRFSLAGYRPVTKLFSALNAPVIMAPAMERTRTLAKCSELVKKDKRQADLSLRMSLPRDIKIRTSADVDSRLLAVGYHVDWMVIGNGATWSFGLPTPKLWKQLVTSDERDITVDDPRVTITDYTGMLNDGSHFRFIGMLGQSISYTEATVDSAAYFDSLLDTLCWAR